MRIKAPPEPGSKAARDIDKQIREALDRFLADQTCYLSEAEFLAETKEVEPMDGYRNYAKTGRIDISLVFMPKKKWRESR